MNPKMRHLLVLGQPPCRNNTMEHRHRRTEYWLASCEPQGRRNLCHVFNISKILKCILRLAWAACKNLRVTFIQDVPPIIYKKWAQMIFNISVFYCESIRQDLSFENSDVKLYRLECLTVVIWNRNILLLYLVDFFAIKHDNDKIHLCSPYLSVILIHVCSLALTKEAFNSVSYRWH
jgi:hypothetical protein